MKKETSRLETIQGLFLAKWTKGEKFKKFQPPSCKSYALKVVLSTRFSSVCLYNKNKIARWLRYEFYVLMAKTISHSSDS